MSWDRLGQLCFQQCQNTDWPIYKTGLTGTVFKCDLTEFLDQHKPGQGFALDQVNFLSVFSMLAVQAFLR